MGKRMASLGYTETDAENELMNYYELTALNARRKFKVPCQNTIDADMKIIMTALKKSKIPKCNTEARHKTGKGKRTFVSLYVVTKALAECYGVVPKGVRIQVDGSEETQECRDGDRVLRGRSSISGDESRGQTYENMREVLTAKGTRTSVPPLKGFSNDRTHGYPFVWGCTGEGAQLAPLCAFQTDAVEKGKPVKLRLDDWAFRFHASQSPIILLFNSADRKELSNIWRDEILFPTLEFMKTGLEEGEMNVVYLDGGEHEHLKPIHDNPAFLHEHKERRAVFVKEHCNSPGKLQVCDLLHLFHWIKEPKNWLKHLNAGTFGRHLEHMTALLDGPLKNLAKFDPAKRGLLIEAMTVLFNVILPNLSPRMIIKQWEVRGTLPRPTWKGAFQQIDPEYYPSASYLQVLEEWEERFVDFCIEHGYLSDELMDQAGLPPCEFSLDDAALRSQRMVIMTHLETIRRVLERRNAPRLRKEAEAKKREEDRLAREKQAEEEAQVVLNQIYSSSDEYFNKCFV